MARYIDADMLKELIDGGYDIDFSETPETKAELLNMIDYQDTADVRENVHGNWVGIDDDPCETFECDRCGFVLEDWILGAFYNFCPNCGADMRGEEDE